jgi:hypothetical protein
VTLAEARSLALQALGISEEDYKGNESICDSVAKYIRRAWADGRISYGQDVKGEAVCAALFRCPLAPEHRGGHAYERLDV